MTTPRAGPIHTAVVGVFPGRAEAERAVAGLRATGFRDDQLGVLGADQADHPPAAGRPGLAGDPTHTR